MQIPDAIDGSVTITTRDFLALVVRRLESVEEQHRVESDKADIEEQDEPNVLGKVLHREELKISRTTLASIREDLDTYKSRATARRIAMILIRTLTLWLLTIATTTSWTRQMKMKPQGRMLTTAAGKSWKARCMVASLGRSTPDWRCFGPPIASSITLSIIAVTG